MLEKNKATCREIIRKFSPDTMIYQRARDYLLNTSWKPLVKHSFINEEIRASYARCDATASAAVTSQPDSRAAREHEMSAAK